MSWRVPISAGPLRRAAVATALGGLCAAAPASAAQDVTSPGAHQVAAASDTAIVPFGARPRIDGKLGEREWADADTFRIQAGARRVVPVLLKHDGQALYVAFTNLPPGKHEEQYPEVLIDASGDGGERWGLDDLWLHASYSNCDARGGFDVYGWAACGDRYGWSANRFPVPGGVIELRVDLDFVGFAASSPGRWFGLALEVTDGSGVRAFWPATSDMLRPGTWARARLTARSARPGR